MPGSHRVGFWQVPGEHINGNGSAGSGERPLVLGAAGQQKRQLIK